jgi:hypothetical protein
MATPQTTGNEGFQREQPSSIGTTNPNTGAVGNTNSTYGLGAYTSGVNPLSGATTAYTLNDTDYQGFVIFNTASACTVTLNSAVKSNFSAFIVNLGSGTLTLTPTVGTVNGAGSVTTGANQGATVFFASGNWYAFLSTTAAIPVIPQTIAAVAGEYLTSYTAATGLFTLSTPAGINATITTAKLTALGSNGSMTFVNGILTAQTPAT